VATSSAYLDAVGRDLWAREILTFIPDRDLPPPPPDRITPGSGPRVAFAGFPSDFSLAFLLRLLQLDIQPVGIITSPGAHPAILGDNALSRIADHLGIPLIRAWRINDEHSRFELDELGLDGDPRLSYRPRSRATKAEQLRAELADRVDSDLERGFTGHGPHRDDVVTVREGRELRAYGSQGQQRLALLALLLAERAALAQRRQTPPVMLLDDVMSELDGLRRRALVDLLRSGGAQAVITATDAEQVPGADEAGVHRLEVVEGGRLIETVAA